MRLALATDALAVSGCPAPRVAGADRRDATVGLQRARTIATRCLHCRTPLRFAESGAPLNGATLEHVVPRSWFGRTAARELTGGLTGPDDARNLALACAACNHAKGRGPDARGPGDARAREVVAAALARRLERWRAEAAAPEATDATEGPAVPAAALAGTGLRAAAAGRGRTSSRAR
jgi:5-methylcytosine-specific restriction endonuclease McrA